MAKPTTVADSSPSVEPTEAPSKKPSAGAALYSWVDVMIVL